MKHYDPYNGTRVGAAVLIVGLIMFLFCLFGYKCQGQCENPTCLTSIDAPSQTLIPFCNLGCGYEYYQSINYMDNTAGPFGFECHQVNFDLWYRIEVETEDSTICLNISDGTCQNSENPGFEGWALMLWRGDYCDTAELIFSTNCYWMTELDPEGVTSYEGIGDFDPTRQEWLLTLHGIENGTYFVQIDSFSWCEGCGVFSWCEGLLLQGLGVEERVKFKENFTPYSFDILGRRVRN